MKSYSNYHGTNENQKISHDGLLLLERSLNGFEGYDVLINNLTESKVLVYQKYDSESTVKKVIGRIGDIDIGNVMTIDNLNWLIITLPEDNKIYRKAEMQLCNSTYPIKTNKTRVLKGLNDFGEKIYDYVDGTVTELPCIVSSTTTSDSVDEAINLPEGQISITLPYVENAEIAEGKEFFMYGSKFKIIGIDYTKSINKVGILIIKGKKV
ncbi:hypothetical protein V7128_01255 [Neobacillus vireti]|uniref:hypothetical protein n=1 Tax=Neobacillus vireti TaxID=220686 RepID=UPI002FFED591